MAFARRFDMPLDFPPPDQEQRRRLWLGHLGTRHALSPSEVERLAAAAELTGGQIRLVVVDCAVSARTQKRPVRFNDVVAALDRQYRQLGRPMPDELVS